MFRSSMVFLIVASFAVLQGCVSIKNIDRNVLKSDIPAIGDVQTAELGSKMLEQKDVEVLKGRKVNNVARVTMGLFPADFFGMYVRANDGEHYCGNITYRDLLNNGKVHFVCFTDQEFKDKGLPYFDTEEIVSKPTNFQKVLEYSGRSGNTITVFYKEFNETKDGSFIRPAFTQEFKFDLSEGKTIGLKGARIEIVNATNTGITYKVLAHFPR